MKEKLIRIYKEVLHTTQRILLDAYKYYVYKEMKDDATLLYFFFPTLMNNDVVFVEVKKLSSSHRIVTELNTYLYKTHITELLRSLRALHPQFDPVLIKENRLALQLNGHIGMGNVYEVVYELENENNENIEPLIEKCPKEDLKRKLKLLHKKLSNEQNDVQNKHKLYIGIGKCIAKSLSKELKKLARKMISDKLPVVFRVHISHVDNKIRITLWFPAPDESLVNALLSQTLLPILRAFISFL